MTDLYAQDLNYAAGDAADWLDGRRVLVTGATGLIGSFLVEALLSLDVEAQVYAAGRSAAGMERRFGALTKDKRFHFVEYDAAKPLAHDLDMDCVVHAACSAHPLAYAADPVGIMQANLLGVMNLLEVLRRRPGGRLVFLSTGEIYGENPDLSEGFSEDGHGYTDPMKPRSCYPESKRAGETLCASYAAQYGVQAVVARLCHVYGPTFTQTNSRADAQFLRNALDHQDIVMKSEGAQVRSGQHPGVRPDPGGPGRRFPALRHPPCAGEGRVHPDHPRGARPRKAGGPGLAGAVRSEDGFGPHIG